METARVLVATAIQACSHRALVPPGLVQGGWSGDLLLVCPVNTALLHCECQTYSASALQAYCVAILLDTLLVWVAGVESVP